MPAVASRANRPGLRAINLVPAAERAAFWTHGWAGSTVAAGLDAAIVEDETERPLRRCVCARVVVLQANVVPATNIADRTAIPAAVGETVILLHSPLPSVMGVSIAMERERQQNDSLAWLNS